MEWAPVYHVKGWGKFKRHYGDFCTGADRFGGTVGWARDSGTGVRELQGEELVDMKRDAQFPEEIRFREFFTNMELKGKAMVGPREAYLIRASSPEGG